jgi:hypothetical protein
MLPILRDDDPMIYYTFDNSRYIMCLVYKQHRIESDKISESVVLDST